MVLFFNLKCWESVFPIMANLARDVEARGVPSHQVICGAGWKCDALRPVKPDPPNCPWGRERLEGYLQAQGLGYTAASEYLPFRTPMGPLRVPEGEAEVYQRCDRVAALLAQEPRPAHDGIVLDEVVKASLARYLRQVYDPSLPTHQAARLEFIRDALCYIEAVGRALDEWQPRAIVIWGGTFYAERIAAILARRRGLRVIAVENTAFRDRIYLDTTGVTGNRHAAAHGWHWLEARALTPAERERLRDYLTAVHSGAASWVPHAQAAGRSTICQFLGIEPQRRLVLLIGQVAVDSVVLMDSPIFPDMRDFILTTAQIIAAHPQHHLVVRLHPAEAMWHDNLTLRRLEGWRMPANCSIVHSKQLNTYDLMRESELGVTLCSQAGLEMLSMGRPVVTAGRAFYSGKGLTHDVTSRAAYPAVLEEALRSPQLADQQREGVETLLYHMIFEYLIPFDRDNLCLTPQAADALVTEGAFQGLAAPEQRVPVKPEWDRFSGSSRPIRV